MMDVPEEYIYIYMLSLLSFVGWKVPLIGGNSSEISWNIQWNIIQKWLQAQWSTRETMADDYD